MDTKYEKNWNSIEGQITNKGGEREGNEEEINELLKSYESPADQTLTIFQQIYENIRVNENA